MISITDNKARVGNFTSSEIYHLVTSGKEKGTFGKPAITYIAEKNMERRLQRSLTTDTNARPLIWGRFLEGHVFDLLGLEYKLCSQETITHPDYSCWCGSPDGEKFDEGKTVMDIKCPMTLKSFCQFADCATIEDIRSEHPDGEKYYWQLVSNAILTGAKYAELIFYVPYQSELETIREKTAQYDGDQNALSWIYYSKDADLPYLIDGGFYKNLNIVRFEVPETDKQFLTARIIEAQKQLK